MYKTFRNLALDDNSTKSKNTIPQDLTHKLCNALFIVKYKLSCISLFVAAVNNNKLLYFAQSREYKALWIWNGPYFFSIVLNLNFKYYDSLRASFNDVKLNTYVLLFLLNITKWQVWRRCCDARREPPHNIGSRIFCTTGILWSNYRTPISKWFRYHGKHVRHKSRF